MYPLPSCVHSTWQCTGTWSPFEKDVMKESLTSMITAGRVHQATCLFYIWFEFFPPQRPGHIHILMSAAFTSLSIWVGYILDCHSSDDSTHEAKRVTAWAVARWSSMVGPEDIHFSKFSRCPEPTLNGTALAPHPIPFSPLKPTCSQKSPLHSKTFVSSHWALH